MVRCYFVPSKAFGCGLASSILGHMIQTNKHAILGVSSDDSLLPVYTQLGEWVAFEKLSCKDCFLVPAEETTQTKPYLQEHILSITDANMLSLHETTSFDCMLLVLKENGTLALNGPGTPFSSCIHTTSEGLTVGLHTIMQAKEVIVIAFGKALAQTVYRTLVERRQTNCPASCLQLHPRCTFIIDEEAGSLIDINKRLLFSMYNSICWRNDDPYKVMIVASEPGEDVMALAATMQSCKHAGHQVMVVYQTSGNLLDSNLPKEAVRAVRRKKAMDALAKLGIYKCVFLDSYFYEKGNKDYEEDDIHLHKDCLELYTPDIVFCCGHYHTLLVEACKVSKHIQRETWLATPYHKETQCVLPFDDTFALRKRESMQYHMETGHVLSSIGTDVGVINQLLDTKLSFVETLQSLNPI